MKSNSKERWLHTALTTVTVQLCTHQFNLTLLAPTAVRRITNSLTFYVCRSGGCGNKAEAEKTFGSKISNKWSWAQQSDNQNEQIQKADFSDL